jgi:type II secretory pathway pseudopilin PulG
VIDVVVSCGVAGIMAGIAIPSLQASRDQHAARLAARYLNARLQVVRLEALRRNTTVAMRFDPGEVGLFAVFADGDGDGVLQRDVDGGIDPRLQPDARLSEVFATVSFRIAATVPAPDGGAVLDAGSDPLRLGASNFLSFSPLGSATSGTLYLAGESGPQMAVRVLGTTGRVRVLWFDWIAAQWRDD